jgi:prophage maintenance system killer protein
MNEIIIYQTSENKPEIEVKFENDTFWLSLNEIAGLFERDKSVISRHLKNIFTSEELDKNSVVAFFATTANDGKTYQVENFNLDAILSVGYRVNSKRGTQFRQWATARLKDFLVKGYAINQKRLDELSQMVSIIAQSTESDELKLNEAKGLLNILGNYTQSYILLNQFDSNSLKTDNLSENITYEITYEDAKPEIDVLKQKLIDLKEATKLFGNEKDDSFKGILGNILQTFDGQYLYPSIEEQAANLLYFVIKNHPFSDGNKRIGAFLFIWFLEKNKHRLDVNGNIKINEYGLVALALLVAQSNPSDKDLMINLIINLIQNQTKKGGQ